MLAGASPISAQERAVRAFIAKGMRGGSLGFFDVGQAKVKANESSSVDLVPDRKFNLVHREFSMSSAAGLNFLKSFLS